MSAVEWRYLPAGAVKHALTRPDDRIAVCGVGPLWYSPDGWRGTGSQVEYETAAGMRECRRCRDWLSR